MGGLLFIVILGIIVFKVVSAKRGDDVRKAWEAAGLDLGLFFEPGGFMSSPRLQGSVDGLRVVVDTFSRRSGNNSTTYTRYQVFYAAPLGLGLVLTQQGSFSGVAKFFGAQDIEIGDPNFDNALVVKAQDAEGVREFLTPDRRYQIWRAVNAWPQVHFEDAFVRLEIRGRERDDGRLRGTVRQLTELAAAMSRRPPVHSRPGSITLAPPLPTPPPPPRFAPPPEPLPPLLTSPEPPEPLEPLPPLPPATEKPPSATPLASPEPSVPAPASASPVTGPTLEALCARVFKPGQTGTDAESLFQELYQNQTICWRGKLRSVQRTSYDVVFGDKPITKASFDTLEVDTGMYGSRKVQAVVQFPEDMESSLSAQTGQSLTFRGKLVRADGLMRTLYISRGELGS